MTAPKRKVSVSLDEDLLAELETQDAPLSAQVNAALRVELDRRRRGRLLADFLDGLDAEDRGVSEDLISKYTDLLQ